MDTCSKILKSQAVQNYLQQSWQTHMKSSLEKNGFLAPNEFNNFKKGFNKSFIRTCKAKSKTASKKKGGRKRKRKTQKYY